MTGKKFVSVLFLVCSVLGAQYSTHEQPRLPSLAQAWLIALSNCEETRAPHLLSCGIDRVWLASKPNTASYILVIYLFGAIFILHRSTFWTCGGTYWGLFATPGRGGSPRENQPQQLFNNPKTNQPTHPKPTHNPSHNREGPIQP